MRRRTLSHKEFGSGVVSPRDLNYSVSTSKDGTQNREPRMSLESRCIEHVNSTIFGTQSDSTFSVLGSK